MPEQVSPVLPWLRCPFCGGKFTAQLEPTPAAYHSMPPCERFVRLEIDEFMREVRLAVMPETNN